ncbi:MAG TPA: hypothetical protein VF546_22490 [Pyrinomonadaceae bacterium]|jgi:hypothetical protein
MKINRRPLAFGLLLLLAAAAACNFSVSTANIASLKLGKNKEANPATTEFAPADTVYAVAEIANVPSKVKVKGRVLVDKVEGEQSGQVIPGTEKELDFEASGTATFNYSVSSGWPPGTYKLEVLMLNEKGEQKDQKSETFTVK